MSGYDEFYKEVCQQCMTRLSNGDTFMIDVMELLKQAKDNSYRQGMRDSDAKHNAITDTAPGLPSPFVVFNPKNMVQMLRDEWYGRGAQI